MTQRTQSHTPTARPSDEATEEQLRLAREQGETFGRAVRHMTEKEAHGAEQQAGDYLVGYAVEDAEGMYHLEGGDLVWHNPQDENAHIEIVVRDAADGRFIPGLRVHVTVVDQGGHELGTHQQELLWHPWLYHYGRNWRLPGDGAYTLRVRIDPATFMRHDRTNGRRFSQPVAVEFTDVTIKTGQKLS